MIVFRGALIRTNYYGCRNWFGLISPTLISPTLISPTKNLYSALYKTALRQLVNLYCVVVGVYHRMAVIFGGGFNLAVWSREKNTKLKTTNIEPRNPNTLVAGLNWNTAFWLISPSLIPAKFSHYAVYTCLYAV